MEKSQSWLIYGANGYTGKLIAKEALKAGIEPVIAGRNSKKIQALSLELGLSYVVFDLNDPEDVFRHVLEHDIVINAAGPFIYTSDALVKACLKAGTHYCDITGEVSVFEKNMHYDPEAKKRGVTVMSGAGFDVVPTDCLALHVSQKIKNPSHLEIAFHSSSTVSAGTSKTMIEHMPQGTLMRKNGDLMNIPFGKGIRSIKFLDKERHALPISWGDLSTAYWSTGVPNIITYMALPLKIAQAVKWVGLVGQYLMRSRILKFFAKHIIDKNIQGPTSQMRDKGKCQIWARASNEDGDEAIAWLESPEGYKLTAITVVEIARRIVAQKLSGYLTPSQAFGADFICEFEGVNRLEKVLQSHKSKGQMKIVS